MSSELTLAQKWSIAALSFITFIVVTSLCVSAWWVFGPVPDTYAVVEPDLHEARYEGGSIIVERHVRIKRPLRLTITRNLLRVNQSASFGVSMPTLEMHADPSDGIISIERAIPAPNLDPGVYELRSTVEWQANPLKRVATPMPPLRFEVPYGTPGTKR